MIERIRWAVVGPVSLAASIAFVAAPKDAGQCAGEKAAVWVQENHDKLPSTLAELRPFSRPYRMTILRHLDPAVRASIWSDHIAEVIASPRVNEVQRAYLRGIQDSLPVWFALNVDDARARIVATDEISKRVLGDSLMIEALSDIAPRASFVRSEFIQGGVGAGVEALAMKSVRGLLGKKSAPWPDCDCNFGSPTNCPPGMCEWGPEFQCHVTYSGCGSLGWTNCDAKCTAWALD